MPRGGGVGVSRGHSFAVEILPCPLCMPPACLYRPMAAPKTLRYLRHDFSQLTDKSVDLFAPFIERAKSKPKNS